MRVEQISADSTFAGGAYGPVAISIWDDSGNVANARQAADLLVKLADQHDKVFILALVGAKAPPPESVVREVLTGAVRRLVDQGRVAAVANTIEGEGFRAAAIRGVLIGMGLMIRPKHPEKVCASVDQAAGFLAANSEGVLTAQGIVDAVAELRRRMPRR